MAEGSCINQSFLIRAKRLDLPTGTAPAITAIGHTGQPSDNPGVSRSKAVCAADTMIARDAFIARDRGV